MTARDELLALRESLRRTFEAEMATIDKAIELLARTAGEHQEQPASKKTASAHTAPDGRFRKMGLTDACRELMGADWKAPIIVRDQLIQGGFKQQDKRKLLAGVFATLKRLSKGPNALLEKAQVDGKMQFRKISQTAAVEADMAA